MQIKDTIIFTEKFKRNLKLLLLHFTNYYIRVFEYAPTLSTYSYVKNMLKIVILMN